ncbi:MAG: shikimate kinase [Bacteroidetes bacterium]|jgi:shikimate kinase|nr:shikimate kinase [Bacteroidota bacterium]
MKKIYFLGMPGCGKSTIGKRVAKELGYSFIDLDTYIEKKENCSIKDIFNYQGEEYFRQTEALHLKDLSILEKDCVISLGGGTPCFYNNMDIVRRTGFSIYIKANEKILLNRLENARSKRPLFWGLTQKEIEQKLIKLIETRSPYYEKAELTVNAANLNEKEIVVLIRRHQAS